MGFANLLRKENGAWWRTRNWLVQSIIWFCVLNGLLATVLWAPVQQSTASQEARAAIREDAAANEAQGALLDLMQEKPTAGLILFFLMSGIALPIAAVIAGQDVIIGEKQSGTAAWVLSKPVSRPAFILAKLLADGLGFLVTGIVVQGVIAYLQVSLAAGAPLSVANFIGGLALTYLNLLFYFTLTLMLGTFFAGRGPVIGIALALLLGYQLLLGIAPGLALIGPWALVMNIMGGLPLSATVALGLPLPSADAVLPMVGTAVWCVVFGAVAIWRFQREEF
jgi:ABC-2 type transport system permease protein